MLSQKARDAVEAVEATAGALRWRCSGMRFTVQIRLMRSVNSEPSAKPQYAIAGPSCLVIARKMASQKKACAFRKSVQRSGHKRALNAPVNQKVDGRTTY